MSIHFILDIMSILISTLIICYIIPDLIFVILFCGISLSYLIFIYFIDKKYTYKIKGKKSLRTLKEEEKNTKPKTYVEQIEEQRNRVRSQILQNKKL